MEKTLISVRSNKLIESACDLDLNQKRLLTLVFLMRGQLSGENQNIWSCSKADFEGMFHTEELSDEYITSMLNDLSNKSIELVSSEGWEKHRIVEAVEYNSGNIILMLSPLIASEVKNTMFGMYSCDINNYS